MKQKQILKDTKTDMERKLGKLMAIDLDMKNMMTDINTMVSCNIR